MWNALREDHGKEAKLAGNGGWVKTLVSIRHGMKSKLILCAVVLYTNNKNALSCMGQGVCVCERVIFVAAVLCVVMFFSEAPGVEVARGNWPCQQSVGYGVHLSRGSM